MKLDISTVAALKRRQPSHSKLISNGPLQVVLKGVRQAQEAARRGLEPDSGLSDHERLNEVLAALDDEGFNAAMEQLERPN